LVIDEYTRALAITVSDSSNGSVTSSAGWTDIDSGSNVTITATGDAGYYLSAWTGNAVDSANPFTWEGLDEDKTVGATFVDSPTIVSMTNLHLFVNWSSDVFQAGDTAKVIATGVQEYGASSAFRINSSGSIMGTILPDHWDADQDTFYVVIPEGMVGVGFSRFQNDDGVLSATDGRKCELIDPGSD
jgi:hypothetical protein